MKLNYVSDGHTLNTFFKLWEVGEEVLKQHNESIRPVKRFYNLTESWDCFTWWPIKCEAAHLASQHVEGFPLLPTLLFILRKGEVAHAELSSLWDEQSFFLFK